MNKTQIIGLSITVLAIIGGVAVYQFLRKPRENKDGFYSANGFASATSNFAKENLKTCKRLNGTYYSEQQGRPCRNGAKEVSID